MMRRTVWDYDDGLDPDGYPIEREIHQPYRRGSESEAGDWSPQSIAAAVSVSIRRIGHFFDLAPRCDSPIETQLGAAIRLAFEGLPIDLIPQFAWSFYRSDWAIVTPLGSTTLIECDGREFHSSIDQRAHDAAKDEAARARGYRTIRFTGSQINKNADECAQRVFETVCRDGGIIDGR